MFRELDRGQHVFSTFIGWSGPWLSNVEVNGELAQSRVYSATPNYYSELGATPFLGRLLTLEDVNLHSGATSQVAVIGYEFWRQRLGGAGDIVGNQIRIEGQPFTIVGVTRKWFTGLTPGEPPDVTVPITAIPIIIPGVFSLDNRSSLWVQITGRIKGGTTIEQARAQLQSFWPEVLWPRLPQRLPGRAARRFFPWGWTPVPFERALPEICEPNFPAPCTFSPALSD